jgi:hypothetical protein
MVMVNKAVLNSIAAPCFLLFCQLVIAVLMLQASAVLGEHECELSPREKHKCLVPKFERHKRLFHSSENRLGDLQSDLAVNCAQRRRAHLQHLLSPICGR